MRRLRLAPLALLCLTACPKKAEVPGNLLSEVKVRLAERDARLSSYRLLGLTQEQGQQAGFEFAYRAPNKMRGELKSPKQRTYSFDGSRLYDLQPEEKRFTAYELKLPAAKAAHFLNQAFSPFVSEGYRVPLLMSEGVTVVRASHPKAPEAVEVKVETRDEHGEKLSVSYFLRWPSGDFLGKRNELGGKVSELRVEEEHCDEPLKMCFPKKVSQWDGQEPLSTTEFSKVEINPQIPGDEFTLLAPAGFDSQKQELVEQGK